LKILQLILASPRCKTGIANEHEVIEMAYTNVETVEWLIALYGLRRERQFRDECVSKPLTKKEFGVLKYIEQHPKGVTCDKIRKQLRLKRESTTVGIVVKLIYLEKVFTLKRAYNPRKKILGMNINPNLLFSPRSGHRSKVYARTSPKAVGVEFAAPVDLYKLL